MYFLGIDPGVRKLGYALIDENLKIHDAGILLQDKKNVTREDYFERLLNISDYFDKLLRQNNIKNVGIEKLFFTKYNQANAEFVYGVRGILLEKFLRYNINIFEYTPKEIKKYITGNGIASKEYVQKFIMKLYSLEQLPEYDDSADALGLAYLVSKK